MSSTQFPDLHKKQTEPFSSVLYTLVKRTLGVQLKSKAQTDPVMYVTNKTAAISADAKPPLLQNKVQQKDPACDTTNAW